MTTMNDIDLHMVREAIAMVERCEPIKDGIPKGLESQAHVQVEVVKRA